MALKVVFVDAELVGPCIVCGFPSPQLIEFDCHDIIVGKPRIVETQHAQPTGRYSVYLDGRSRTSLDLIVILKIYSKDNFLDIHNGDMILSTLSNL